MSGFHPFQHLPTNVVCPFSVQNCRFPCKKNLLHTLRALPGISIGSRLMKSFQREHIDVCVHTRRKHALAGKTKPRRGQRRHLPHRLLRRKYTPAHIAFKQPHVRSVHARMHQSLRGIGAVGDHAGRLVAQDRFDVFFGSDKVDHAHRAVLVCQQVKRTVKRVFLLHGCNLRNRLSLKAFVLRQCHARSRQCRSPCSWGCPKPAEAGRPGPPQRP